MPIHHTLGYRVTVGLLIAGALVVLATVLAPLVRRGDGGVALQAARDSLAVARAEIAHWQRVNREQDELLAKSTDLLDSVLRVPPHVVYIPRTRTETRTDTIIVAATDSAATDTSNTSAVPYVPLADYTTLETRCTEYRGTCQAALAAKDSLLAAHLHADSAQSSVISQMERTARRTRWAALIGRIRDLGLGAAAGAITCKLLCP